MEISGKRKRKNEEEEETEAEMEKFSEIVEKFRGPYEWFRAKMLGSTSSIDGDEYLKKTKEKIVVEVEDDDSKGGCDVWMPCFVLEDFQEEEAVKVWKSMAAQQNSAAVTAAAAAAAAAERIDGGGGAGCGEKKETDEDLNLRLSL